ncbi:alpha/beta hydrolase [Colwellia sp. MB02u-10]|jgi:pimeloyl-ACP methyl ester carboxylesterase|uniref:alpha/beta fold hydrolase n=1 Tax=Colwellia sp. MB02u-10 TaxID=2759828 RepID=UPI0015F36D26|nr:alpha/beta hydrolase [Colwellia sp. MB02u-10]MBA6341266.1 alpha/beta hydrolase [Colwellia sp. MB02u-10]
MIKAILSHTIYPHKTSKEWVVFVHGAGGSSAVWFRQIRAFQQQHNVLLLDLRGHGKSSQLVKSFVGSHYSFNKVSEDIIDVLDHNNIACAHFVGISLGTIIIRNIAEIAPTYVSSMVLGGAITRFNVRSNILVYLGNTFKHCLPYMWLYRLFAFIMMPKKRHKESRHLFVREAKRLCQKEFIRWFKLAMDVNPLMRYFKEKEIDIPILYIMGKEDHMFLEPVKEMVKRHKNSLLHTIHQCGHVCNVESPDIFNKHSLAFIAQQNN